MSTIKQFIFILLTFILTLHAGDDEHALFPVIKGGMTSNQYFNQQNIPNIYTTHRTKKNCKENCNYPVVVDANGNALRTYANGSSLGTIAYGRYENIAYLQYTHNYPCGEKSCSTTHLLDNTGQVYTPLQKSLSAYDRLISKDRKMYELKGGGIYINGIAKVKSNKLLVSGKLNNNPLGDITAVAIDKHDVICMSNMDTWWTSTIHLSEHGDRDDILAIYPKNHDELMVVVYKYTNIYNKGLMVARINMQTSKEESGLLFNAANHNVGFSPSIYWQNGINYVSAKDSTKRERVSIQFSDLDFTAIASIENYPEHIKGFEEEEYFTFLLGTRLAQYNWDAKSYVEQQDVKYSKMEYDISDSIYTALYFEGRIKNVEVGVSYLQNWVEEQGTSSKVASKVFSVFVGFNDLFSKSSSLRIEIEKANISGSASYTRNDNTGLTTGPSSQTEFFEEKFTDLSVKIMFERGWFAGLEYMDFTLPSAVGFSNSVKQMEYITIDPSFNVENYMFIAGYDEISYARRYETDLSHFYVQGTFGFGISTFTLSTATRQQVENDTSKQIQSSYSVVFTGEANTGYIWQSRFKELRGFGYAFTTGLKARGSWTSIGQSKESDTTIDASNLALEMERYDVWYGPYVSFNLLF